MLEGTAAIDNLNLGRTIRCEWEHALLLRGRVFRVLIMVLEVGEGKFFVTGLVASRSFKVRGGARAFVSSAAHVSVRMKRARDIACCL